jgi:hypothetical protein
VPLKKTAARYRKVDGILEPDDWKLPHPAFLGENGGHLPNLSNIPKIHM